MSDKQVQKAGANSQQIQAGTIVVNNNLGITEERARAIYTEMSLKAISNNTVESFEKAKERIEKLEALVIPRVESIDKFFESFSDPSFQVLLRKAQLTAACTDREDDYKILSELLVHRIENRANIKKKASITKAIEIIDQIDNDSLCAMTVLHSMKSFAPNSGIISEGLATLAGFYEKLNLENLPNDNLWMDNLSVLGAATIIPFSRMRNFEEYIGEMLNGYVCVGIKKDSSEYQSALQKLNECRIHKSILIDNELLDGFVRMPFTTEKEIPKLRLIKKEIVDGKLIDVDVPITESQLKCLSSIWDMYSKDVHLQAQVKAAFSGLFQKYEPIKRACNWWDSINLNVSLTSVGKVIAHTNAKSIDNSLPDLD
ncbi:hypothetical protein H5999_05245 [[Clostridium] spiroforme]|nr:hypothetical protein [Thomasclavelia spiroformis]